VTGLDFQKFKVRNLIKIIFCFLLVSLLFNNCGSKGGFTSLTSSTELPSLEVIPLCHPSCPTPLLTPVIQSLTVTPTVITPGQSATLSWLAPEATALTLSSLGDVTGKTSQLVSPTVTTTYTLTASNLTGIASQSITVVVSSGNSSAGMPAWRQGMAPFQWKKIPLTSINLIKPVTSYDGFKDMNGLGIAGGLYGRLAAWNGLAADTSTDRVYSAGSGGHADYAGNEVYEIDFSKDVPAWVILREPSAPQNVGASNGTKGLYYDYYLDGRPASTHTYYALQFITSQKSIFKFGAGSLYGTGNEGNSYIDQFSLTKNDWELGPNNRPFFGATARQGVISAAVCKSPVSDEVYIGAVDGLKKFNPASSQVTKVADYFQNNSEITYHACAVDPVHQQVIFFGDAYNPSNGGYKYDIATGKYSRLTFTGTATSSIISWSQAYAWYDESLQAFTLKVGTGSKIIRIDPQTFETTESATTGGETMPDAMNGVETRFQRLPNLKGYVYYPNDTDGFWFLATE
jgi:hypothetical protein